MLGKSSYPTYNLNILTNAQPLNLVGIEHIKVCFESWTWGFHFRCNSDIAFIIRIYLNVSDKS